MVIFWLGGNFPPCPPLATAMLTQKYEPLVKYHVLSLPARGGGPLLFQPLRGDKVNILPGRTDVFVWPDTSDQKKRGLDFFLISELFTLENHTLPSEIVPMELARKCLNQFAKLDSNKNQYAHGDSEFHLEGPSRSFGWLQFVCWVLFRVVGRPGEQGDADYSRHPICIIRVNYLHE